MLRVNFNQRYRFQMGSASLITKDGLMKSLNKKLVIIAPDSLLGALRILFQAAPNIDLLAAGVSVTAIKEIEKSPEIAFVWLAKDNIRNKKEAVTTKVIEELKNIWPDICIVAIVNDVQQYAKVQTLGADEILFEGIKPVRLLAAIKEIKN